MSIYRGYTETLLRYYPWLLYILGGHYWHFIEVLWQNKLGHIFVVQYCDNIVPLQFKPKHHSSKTELLSKKGGIANFRRTVRSIDDSLNSLLYIGIQRLVQTVSGGQHWSLRNLLSCRFSLKCHSCHSILWKNDDWHIWTGDWNSCLNSIYHRLVYCNS